MVAKKRRTKVTTKKGRVKVGNLKLNRETLKDLSGKERKQIKGGALALTRVHSVCGCA